LGSHFSIDWRELQYYAAAMNGHGEAVEKVVAATSRQTYIDLVPGFVSAWFEWGIWSGRRQLVILRTPANEGWAPDQDWATFDGYGEAARFAGESRQVKVGRKRRLGLSQKSGRA
jgi:hypothetical protein